MELFSLVGNSIKRIGFDDVLYAIQHPDDFIFINTLGIHEQECLILHTLSIDREEMVINEMLQKYDSKIRRIILYGKHSNDTSVERKYKQLMGLGIGDVFIYSGGLFEWMLLQDIYGEKEFPTTKKVLDILKYRPSRIF